MVLLWALLLGLVIGLIRHRGLAHLAKLKLRASGLVLLAVLIQILILPLGQNATPIVTWGMEYWHIASYMLLLLFAVINYRERALWPMALGMLSNFIVITVNGGHMPASLDALRAAGRIATVERLLTDGVSGNVMLMSEQTRLNFLGDILWLPSWVPFANAFSIGDLLLGAGVIWLLVKRPSSPTS
ncbi:MAG: DUF5317 domain-containing protein [Candidatus Bipolaricaulota bacterium]|nr:DUF5317 domain-containing protein [Candidatus Bipolaricaulota bacterium]MDW8030405.1 DUF5317 domain-containing protein [Candidatus Bipolaricaulota bacterium]